MSDASAAREHNRLAWDRMVRGRHRFTRPARDANFVDPLNFVDGKGWLGASVRGQRLLCLAAGGGKHAPLYAAAGAQVTVVDLSAAMLELDRQVATERKLTLRTVQASMDNLSMLDAGGFDIVVHPVSTCYLPRIDTVYREVARVIRGGGLYISQHKQPASLQAAAEPGTRGYQLTEPYYRDTPLPEVVGSPHREEGTREYLHRWECLIGELCRAGFVLEDLIEPVHAKPDAEARSFAERSRFLPPYVRLKARRIDTPGTTSPIQW